MVKEKMNFESDNIQARETFWRDGCVCLRNIFDISLIESLREAVEKDLQSPGPLHRNRTSPNGPGLFFVDFQLWQRHKACGDFVFNSNVAKMISFFLNSNKVTFYHDHLLVKEAGTLDPTPWHHDLPYYPLEGHQICSLWLPLDPVDKKTCVEFVKGSHQFGSMYAPQYFNPEAKTLKIQDQNFQPIPDFSSFRHQYEFLSWDMEVGDCLIFHALTVHGAPGNLSADRRRRAWATRWCGDDVKYKDRQGEVSPPLNYSPLKSGDFFKGDQFPLVFPRKQLK